jgi:hypothetical protein
VLAVSTVCKVYGGVKCALERQTGIPNAAEFSGGVDGPQLVNNRSHLTEPFTKAITPSSAPRHSRSYLRIRIAFLFASLSLTKLPLYLRKWNLHVFVCCPLIHSTVVSSFREETKACVCLRCWDTQAQCIIFRGAYGLDLLFAPPAPPRPLCTLLLFAWD